MSVNLFYYIDNIQVRIFICLLSVRPFIQIDTTFLTLWSADFQSSQNTDAPLHIFFSPAAPTGTDFGTIFLHLQPGVSLK